MFSELTNVLNPIISNSLNADYDTAKQKFVKTLKYSNYEKLISMINCQTPIQEKEYTLYKLEYENLIFEKVSDIINPKSDEYHTIIDSTDSCLLLNALSPSYLANYILDNNHLNNIFLTLNYGSNLHNAYHQSGIHIDNCNKKIYMIDPNGKSTYFNSIFNQDTNFYVELMLSKYLNELSSFGLNYKYVYSTEWNPDNIAINKRFNNAGIDDGHCVITTLLLINIICCYNTTPTYVVSMLKELEDEELLYFIKEYSVGVYNLLCTNQ